MLSWSFVLDRNAPGQPSLLSDENRPWLLSLSENECNSYLWYRFTKGIKKGSYDVHEMAALCDSFCGDDLSAVSCLLALNWQFSSGTGVERKIERLVTLDENRNWLFSWYNCFNYKYLYYNNWKAQLELQLTLFEMGSSIRVQILDKLAFHFAQMTLGKAWIYVFFFKLWVNNRRNLVL